MLGDITELLTVRCDRTVVQDMPLFLEIHSKMFRGEIVLTYFFIKENQPKHWDK